MYCFTQASTAFFCADEPDAWSWPLASSHLMLLELAADEASPLPVEPVSSEPHAVRARAPETATTPRERARSRFLR
jgi:hypothetical protein